MTNVLAAFLIGLGFGLLIGLAAMAYYAVTRDRPRPAPTTTTTAAEEARCAAQRASAQKSVRDRLANQDHGGHIDYNEQDAVDMLRAARSHNKGKRK